MLDIRPIKRQELPLLKDFAPPEWNTDLSVTYSFHFGQPYFYPIAAELDGKVIGCAQGLLNGKAGWLGNIVVLPEARGGGVGTALTQHLIEFFHSRGCSSQILTATEMGEPVYRKLGFVETARYVFLKREESFGPELTTPQVPLKVPAPSAVPSANIRRAEEKDCPAILNLDREVSDEERAPFLSRFLGNAWVYEAASSRKVEGFYLPDLKDGLVFACNEEAGLMLMRFKLSQGKTLFVLPEGNAIAHTFLKERGFAESRRAPRMVLGEEVLWKPDWIFSRGAGYCG